MNRTSQNRVILIKLGGSVITNKDIPMSLRRGTLKRLVAEIARAKSERPETLFILGHGQGSFGHVPAAQYKTMQGFVNSESLMGMAIVQDIAAGLNRIVVRTLIEHGIPAVSLYASNSLVTRYKAPVSSYPDVFEEYLKKGLCPVTGGDVIVDRAQGCTIWSTEEILSFFAREFLKRGWKVEQIVHAVEVDGVYDLQKRVVPEISQKNWPEVRKAITGPKGFDVTGGMLLKVQESLDMAKLGISSKILSGLKKDNLYNVLVNKSWKGTAIF